jgi:hypothetical protein
MASVLSITSESQSPIDDYLASHTPPLERTTGQKVFGTLILVPVLLLFALRALWLWRRAYQMKHFGHIVGPKASAGDAAWLPLSAPTLESARAVFACAPCVCGTLLSKEPTTVRTLQFQSKTLHVMVAECASCRAIKRRYFSVAPGE